MLETLTVLRMDGDFDSVIDLLQGQVTSDCSALSHGIGQPSALCDEKGYVLCNFDIILQDLSVFIVIPADQESTFILEINKFAAFYKVSVLLTDIQILGLLRSMNEKLLKNEHLIIKTGNCVLTMLLSSGSEKRIFNDLESMDLSNWHINRKLLGDHAICLSNQGKHRPHELMQNHLRVSFTKGCFRGQEIIARMEYLGKQKMHTKLIIHSELNEIEQYNIIGETYPHEGKLFSSCMGKINLFSSQ